MGKSPHAKGRIARRGGRLGFRIDCESRLGIMAGRAANVNFVFQINGYAERAIDGRCGLHYVVTSFRPRVLARWHFTVTYNF